MVEDHIQILVNYPGGLDKFRAEVLEKGLDYQYNQYSEEYRDKNRTVLLKLVKRNKAENPLNKTPLEIVSTRKVRGFNLALTLTVPAHVDLSSRNIKGHYFDITQYLGNHKIKYSCPNPPREERHAPSRPSANGKGLEDKI